MGGGPNTTKHTQNPMGADIFRGYSAAHVVPDKRDTESLLPKRTKIEIPLGCTTYDFEFQPGLVEGKGDGLFGTVSHIMSYNPGDTRHFLAPFVNHELSVCSSWQIWLKHAFYILFSLVIMFYCGYESFPDGEMGDNVGCPSTAPFKNIKMCQLLKILGDAKDDFQFLIAFVLAGYVASCVATWNSRRSAYGTLCGKTKACAIAVLTALPVPGPEGNPNYANILSLRTQLSRWIGLGYELGVLKARGKMDSESGRYYLEREGLLAPGGAEWRAMSPGDRHTSVFSWLSMKVRQCKEADLMSDPAAAVAGQAIIDLRGAANDIMDSICKDQPFPYTALCGMLVKLNLIIMCLWKATEWAKWLHMEGPYLLFSSPRIWFDILSLFAWNVSYAALYDLGYCLYNPFGARRIDLAHEPIGKMVRKFVEDLGHCVAAPAILGTVEKLVDKKK
jgi:hypothetical protein